VTILPDHAHPLVRAAVTALDSFGAVSAREATILIGYWARRDELTAADITDVLSHYGDRSADRPPAPRPATADDATGRHHTEGGPR
jgi:hypothetical protein